MNTHHTHTLTSQLGFWAALAEDASLSAVALLLSDTTHARTDETRSWNRFYHLIIVFITLNITRCHNNSCFLVPIAAEYQHLPVTSKSQHLMVNRCFITALLLAAG